MAHPNNAGGLATLGNGYNGTIMARGRMVKVMDGHAFQDGQHIFIDKSGNVPGRTGNILGHVGHDRVLTKGPRLA